MKNWEKSLEFFNSISPPSYRIGQAQVISNLIDLHTVDNLRVIETGASQNLEDGCFGFLFAHLAFENGGEFHSVDIDQEISERSESLLKETLLEFNNSHHYKMDSVKFLREFEGSPDLVHLDSWDLDIYNPEPSMLHGFLEFLAIKDKMKSGSYIAVDDNFMQGTIIYWNIFSNGEFVKTDEYTVSQEILGKGSMIYHYCKFPESEWEILGDHYVAGPNIKLVIRKK